MADRTGGLGYALGVASSACFLLTACGHGTLSQRVAELTPKVAELRGLAFKRPVIVRVLDGEAYRLATTASEATKRSLDLSDDPEAWAAFGVASWTRGGHPPSVVAGIYDYASHSMVLPAIAPTWASTDADVDATLVHELEHALQDQTFGGEPMLHTQDADELLAVRALYEGDANLVELRWRKTLDAAPPPNMTKYLRGPAVFLLENGLLVTTDGTLLALKTSSDFRRAPFMLTECFFFETFSGIALALDLFGHGDFARLDAAFARPPRSTEQVLHFEKYLSDERPIEVAVPIAPTGYHVRASGRMGELRTRTLLNSCLPFSVAQEAAAGWGAIPTWSSKRKASPCRFCGTRSGTTRRAQNVSRMRSSRARGAA